MKAIDKNLTIVIVNDFDYIQGGASKVAIDTAKLLYSQGYNVIFFSGMHSENDYVDYGYKNVSLNLPESLNDKNRVRGIINGIYNFYVKREFGKFLDGLDAKKTIIHFHGWTKVLSSSVFDIAFKKGFKTVLTLHDYFTICPNGGCFNYKTNEICPFKGNSVKCIFSNCDSRNYFFKIYRNLRFFVQNRIVKLTERITNVIYISDLSWDVLKIAFPSDIHSLKICNPIDLDVSNVKDPHVRNYYLYVGRITKEKGVDVFCQAITNLGLKGIVVGDGSEKEKLEMEYSNIKFVGWQPSDVVYGYMKYAKCLVFPSLWYETAGLTLLESLELKTPVIISDTCAGKEFVTSINNGTTFKRNDVKDLEKKIKELPLKKNVHFVNNFTREAYLGKLLEFYEEIEER